MNANGRTKCDVEEEVADEDEPLESNAEETADRYKRQVISPAGSVATV